MKYSIDTSAILDAWRRRYPPDVFPAVWVRFDEAIDAADLGASEEVLLEVEKTFDFYKATSASDRIDKVVLSGGASLVDGFDHAVRERLDTDVERFDPFRQVAIDVAKLGAGAVEDYAPVCAVAVGLALRKGGDR